MKRKFLLPALAVTLLVAGALTLILGRTESADRTAPDSVPSETSVAESTNPRGPRGTSTTLVPSRTGVSAPGRGDRSRDARSARAAFLAAKRQHVAQAKTGQTPVSVARPARESLPPEEVAGMEARGMDWRGLERMMREGAPGAAAPPVEPQPLQLEDADDAE